MKAIKINVMWCEENFVKMSFYFFAKTAAFSILEAVNFVHLVNCSLQKVQKEFLNVVKWLITHKIWMIQKSWNFHTVPFLGHILNLGILPILHLCLLLPCNCLHRHFQYLKHSVEIWEFYCHSDFTRNHIWQLYELHSVLIQEFFYHSNFKWNQFLEVLEFAIFIYGPRILIFLWIFAPLEG